MAVESGQVRVACPHNCREVCGQVATVEDGVVTRIDGDPAHPFTQGRLCAKGYGYLSRLYARDRLRHPMVQEPRGSGNWRRISWEEALDRIAQAMLRLHDRYGSLRPVAYWQGSGDMGLLATVNRALWRAMGPLTEVVPNLCYTQAVDAQVYDFGSPQRGAVDDLLNARTVIFWGYNPAWTATHLMGLALKARDRGARLITVDPVVSATASLSHQHLAIRPATDGALALGMARHLLDRGLIDQDFLADQTYRAEPFLDWLKANMTVAQAAAETGLTAQAIRGLAERYAAGPSVVWVGPGLQRVRNGGQAIRAIDALAALAGQIGRPGTGVKAGQASLLPLEPARLGLPARASRRAGMAQFEAEARRWADPPVRLMFIAGANPLDQAPNADALRRIMAEMEMVVVADQFLTTTAREADLVLPATTYLERLDLNISTLHGGISINQRAIAPLYEARSDLAITQGLVSALNRLRPGFCDLPCHRSDEEWLDQLWDEKARLRFGRTSWRDLCHGSAFAQLPQVPWSDHRFATPSGRFEFWSERAAQNGLPPMPVYIPPVQPPDGYPYRLLSPHRTGGINSCQMVDPTVDGAQPAAEIHPETAASLGLGEGDPVRIYNPRGELRLPVHLTRTVLPGVVVVYSGDAGVRVNRLTSAVPAAMGGLFRAPGAAFGDTFVAVEPLETRR